MDLEIDAHNIEKGLHDLFKFAFVSNCNLDDESITSEESKTLEDLELSEILENFKDLVFNLLKFKKEFKTSEKAELAMRNEQFENLLQKLEAEVRNHIRVQHQLKLHIENHQQRISELEKTEQSYKIYIKELEDARGGKKGGKSGEFEKFRREFDDKIRTLTESNEKKDKLLHKIENENSRLKVLLEEKAKECEMIKKDLSKINKLTPNAKELHISSSIDYLKKKLENNKSQAKIKERTPVNHKDSLKTSRKSLEETEIGKLLSSQIVKKEEMKMTGKVAKQRGHIRSISDQKFMNSKRTPSR